MARGVEVVAPLPKVSFVKIDDDALSKPVGVADNTARGFGYNDGSEFQRPEHYIRYSEPLERELAVQVEYDMDEQDMEWLDSVNAERKKEQGDRVSCETFEIIMDRLEKDWFDLTKNLPKPDMVMPSEDSTCAICDDSEGENTNAIVFCDGCNLAVHQDCYGVPYIPEGQWLCRKCTVSPETPVSCILCPNEGGAFKQTVLGDWVHLLCAIWIPETRVMNETFMEPITDADKIPKQRWKLKCSVCDIREGACIQCSKSSCFLAFHATCARKEKFLMPMKSAHGCDAPSLACYCEKHLTREQQESREKAIEVEHEKSKQLDSSPGSKSARAYATTYTSGPPLVPALVVDSVMQYIAKIHVRRKLDFVLLVCKYWSLKREARRGAPLLKRLHLEPWTASNSGNGSGNSEADNLQKLNYLKTLRQDLERLQNIIDVARQRELQKAEQACIVHDALAGCLYPHEDRLRWVFDRISGADRNEYFKNPVSRAEVPDYYEKIKKPMCWSVIEGKLERHEYWDLQTFKDDITLVIDNAIKYNKYDTQYYKVATRLRALSKVVLPQLNDTIVPRHLQGSAPSFEVDQEEVDPSAQYAEASNRLGDLEPPLRNVELLFSSEILQEDEDMEFTIGDKDPISALVAYELGVPRWTEPSPPPPPSPSPSLPPPPSLPSAPTPAKGKAKGKSKKKPAKSQTVSMDVEQLAVLDSTPDFRAPVPPAQEDETQPQAVWSPIFYVHPESWDQHPDTGTPIESKGKKGKGKTKASAGPTPVPTPVPGSSGPEHEPNPIETIDKQQSFKMFNEGWILPPDQKRGGRTRVERPPPLPSKKKKPAASKPSILKSPPHQPAELAMPPPVESATEDVMDVDVEPPHQSPPQSSPQPPSRPTSQPPSYPPPQLPSPLPLHPPSPLPLQPLSQFPPQPPPRLPSTPPSQPPLQPPSQSPSQPPSQPPPQPPSQIPPQPPSQPTFQLSPQSPSQFPPQPTSQLSPQPAPQPSPQPTFKPPPQPTSQPSPQPTSQSLLQPQIEMQQSLIHPGAVSDTGLPVQSIQESVDSRGNRIVIIEELDTPATRRERTRRAKAERARLAAVAETNMINATEAPTLGEPVRVAVLAPDGPTPRLVQEESDLSSLSGDSDEASGGEGLQPTTSTKRRGRGKVQVQGKASRPKSPGLGNISLTPGERLESGTLVWAKYLSYPWWSAVVYDDDLPEIPRNVLQQVHNESDYLVRFYDKSDLWAWIPPDMLKLLGEIEELDQDMLATNSKRQKWKSAAIRAECRHSHKRAMMEKEDEGAGEGAEDDGSEAKAPTSRG